MAYIGLSPTYGAFEKQVLTADGSTTTFTLNYTVGSSSSILVSVAGVHQEPEVAYNLGSGGTQIVFTAAPAAIDTVFVIFLGVAFEVATLGTGSITGQTALSTGVQGADTLLIYDDSAASLKKINLDDLITGQTELAETPASDDVLLVYDTSATEIKKVQKSYLNPTLTYASGTATGDGSTVAFSINSGRTVEDVVITVNGFHLTPTTDYTISGTTLTFVTAPGSSAEITFRYLPLGGAYTSANFTGNGSATTITIDAGRAVDNVLVIVNGLTLVPTTDYTISTTTLTFVTAPAASAEITVRYLRLT